APTTPVGCAGLGPPAAPIAPRPSAETSGRARLPLRPGARAFAVAVTTALPRSHYLTWRAAATPAEARRVPPSPRPPRRPPRRCAERRRRAYTRARPARPRRCALPTEGLARPARSAAPSTATWARATDATVRPQPEGVGAVGNAGPGEPVGAGLGGGGQRRPVRRGVESTTGDARSWQPPHPVLSSRPRDDRRRVPGRRPLRSGGPGRARAARAPRVARRAGRDARRHARGAAPLGRALGPRGRPGAPRRRAADPRRGGGALGHVARADRALRSRGRVPARRPRGAGLRPRDGGHVRELRGRRAVLRS